MTGMFRSHSGSCIWEGDDSKTLQGWTLNADLHLTRQAFADCCFHQQYYFTTSVNASCEPKFSQHIRQAILALEALQDILLSALAQLHQPGQHAQPAADHMEASSSADLNSKGLQEVADIAARATQ